MSATRPLLELTDVTKRYRSPGSNGDLAVLNGVSLSINAGESLSIVGPSGSGKSTLLQIIGTLDLADSGQVVLNGENLCELDDRRKAAVRNLQIGFVFQAHHLLPQCSLWENVLAPTLVCEVDAIKQSAPERAERLLKRVGLAERKHHRPGELSGGERQRAAVVRALINRPRLLLADEPTGALDHTAATSLAQLLVDLNREEGVTLIVVTHAQDLARRMNRVFELVDGRLINRAA